MVAAQRRRTVPRSIGNPVVEVAGIGLRAVSDATVRRVVRLLLVLLQHDFRASGGAAGQRAGPGQVRRRPLLQPTGCRDAGGRHGTGTAAADVDRAAAAAAAQPPPPFADALTGTVMIEWRLHVFRDVIPVYRYLTAVLQQLIFAKTVRFVWSPAVERAIGNVWCRLLKHAKPSKIRCRMHMFWYAVIRKGWTPTRSII